MICGMLKKTVRNTGRGLGKGAGKMYKIVKADLDKADFDDSIEEEDDTVEVDTLHRFPHLDFCGRTMQSYTVLFMLRTGNSKGL